MVGLRYTAANSVRHHAHHRHSHHDHHHSSPSNVGRRNSEAEEIRVPQSIYLTYVKHQIEDERACLELPFTIILLISFSALAVMHLRQDLVFMVEQGIEQDVLENANFAFSHAFGHKGIFDVHSIADFWSWVRLGFIPLVIQPTWSYSENYNEDVQSLFNYNVPPSSKYNLTGGLRPTPDTGDYLHYHRIIGGIRFRQEIAVASEDSCKFPAASEGEREAWLQWYGKPCMPAEKRMPFPAETPDAEDFGEGQRIEWLFTDLDSLPTMIAHAIDMEDGCSLLASKSRTECLCEWCAQQEPRSPWLTELTTRVEISMATFNAEYGLISLTGVNFWFNRGSFIHKRVEVQSSWIDPLSTPVEELVPMLVCDFVWLASLVYITINELREIGNVIRAGESRWYKTLWRDYVAFWNMVDWISISVALFVVGFYGALLSRTMDLHVAFEAYLEAPRAELSREAYGVLVRSFYDALDLVIQAEKQFRMSLCIYPMMVMLRLFKSFAAQPRLAMVTETMKEAYQDMLHFSLVFLGVTICLCLNAVLLFGQDLEEFATLPRALHSCFRMMFGDWDWKPMEHMWRTAAMVWFWMFMMLIVIILLNMLLAIVMDNYMNVKKRSSQAITLSDQIKAMWRRYKQNQRKERVRLTEIWQWFADDSGSEKKMMREERLVTAPFLLEHVKSIPLDQATRTLKNALEEHIKATEDDFELEDAVEPLQRLNRCTKLLRDGLFYVYERTDFYDTELSAVERKASEADAVAAAAAVTASAFDGSGSRVTWDVLDFVDAEVQRLSSEMASNLAQTIKRTDKRQGRIEQRQADMLMSVREMHAALLNLQSEASSLASRLQRISFDRKQSKVSAWRRNLASGFSRGQVPACLDCTPADATEALLPGVRRSGTGMSLPAG